MADSSKRQRQKWPDFLSFKSSFVGDFTPAYPGALTYIADARVESMSRQWVHDNVGEPENNIPPRVIMKQEIGRIERFTVEDLHIPIIMQIRYNMAEMVEAVTFLPASELR